MYESKVRDMVFSSLVADAYCLGTHWIYDEEQLKTLAIDWNQLNNAHSIWHKNKIAGEFTHYGDQTYFFYEFMKNKEIFYVNQYIKSWYDKMKIYDGYLDGATRDTMKNLDEGIEVPCGSTSRDFSVVSRIIPLLLVSSSKEAFIKNAQEFVSATHNDDILLETTKFFAHLLCEILEGNDIVSSIERLKESYSRKVQEWISQGLESKHLITFETIRNFGPACSVEGAFACVIHILVKYTNFKEAMIMNAQAGGDNSARAMMIAPLLIAAYGVNKIPVEWTKLKHTI